MTKLPDTPRPSVVDLVHGVAVHDPYRWLESGEAPEVRAWAREQDRIARETLERLPQREELKRRFTELLYVDAISAPLHRNGRYFFARKHRDKEKAIVYWKEGSEGPERVLLDPHEMSDDGTVSLGEWSLSRDGTQVAYLVKQNNADEATLRVREVATGRDSSIDVIAGAKYASPSWLPDGSGFYYTWLPDSPELDVALRPGRACIRFHELGSDPKHDRIVFPETGDSTAFIGVELSRDGLYLMLYVFRGWDANDVYFMTLAPEQQGRVAQLSPPPLDEADGSLPTVERVRRNAEARGFKPLVVGRDVRCGVSIWQECFYVLTNDGAPRYRAFVVDPARPAREQWTEIVPEGEATIDNLQVIGGHLLLSYLRNASSELVLHRLNGSFVRKIELPGIGTSPGMVGAPDEDEAYFSFSSFTLPTRIYRTSIRSGETRQWAEVKIPVDTSGMSVEQVWYRSKDGTPVSMFLVHRRDLERTGDHPTLLYGYGGFNLSLTPDFSSTIVSWVLNGGVYAVANLRGGGEYGEQWHRAGMLLEKQNVFDDFIGAAEFLIDQGYTSPRTLGIHGGSNGGLLVGAAMVQRPELFRAVVCAVPLLDMVRYHLFGSGRTWIPEYGSAEDPEQFTALLSYSPYHHIERGTAYPALLVQTADSDDRVDPLHARKFTAAVQWATTARDHPVLMRVESNAGHGGADLVRTTVEYHADQFAFLMWQLGMGTEPHPA